MQLKTEPTAKLTSKPLTKLKVKLKAKLRQSPLGHKRDGHKRGPQTGRHKGQKRVATIGGHKRAATGPQGPVPMHRYWQGYQA